MNWILRLLLFAVTVTFSQASLTYDFTKKTIHADPADDVVDVEFHFTNTGKKSIEVLEITTECSCIKARSYRRKFEPGESGKVESQFKVGTLGGTVTKPLFVVTDDKTNPRQQLTIEMKIPKVLEFSPQSIRWETNEPPESKSFQYKVFQDTAIHIKEVTSSRQNVAVEVTTIEAGREYKITLTPKTTAVPQIGYLKVANDCTIKKYQNQMLFFSIAPPKKGTD